MGAHYDRQRSLADSQFGGGSTTWAPGTWYLGLSLTVANSDGTGFTEPVGGAYARLAVLNNTTNFPAAQTIGGITQKWNGAKLTFANPTGTWGLIGWYGWFTALSGGTPQYSNQLDSAITVRNGNTPVEFDVNQLIMTWA